MNIELLGPRMKRRLAVLVFMSISLPVSADVFDRPLDREGYVASRIALEELLWHRRIWPTANPGPRPQLDPMQLLAIRERALDDLRKAEALRSYWSHPLASAEVQEELDRMVAHSKDPALLRDMFAVLQDEPERVAMVMAVPLLADRLARSAYAADPRSHGEIAARARSARERISGPAEMSAMGGVYREETIRRADGEAPDPHKLGEEEWRQEMEWLAAQFPEENGGDGPPLGVMSPVREDDRRFYVVSVLERGDDRVVIAWVEWPKVPYEQWWARVRTRFAGRLPAMRASLRLPPLRVAACTDDSWMPTHLGTPAGRAWHRAVWTGTEMIVWGGSRAGGGGYYSSGGRYDPATDTWLPTSEVGAPSPRYLHTAVWTGTQMIVWGGGQLSAGLVDTGGRYNPTTDSWQATSITSAPQGRANHSAVWTGTQMIVWGGYRLSPTTYLNTGGRYTPSTNSWLSTSTTGAPSVRSMHTAVWASSAGKMIVWGGYDGVSPTLDTGGRYTPASNSWQSTSTVNAPTPRYRHTAAWSGSRMIVWGGGGSASSGTNTGGRYDPVGNTWQATTTTGAPTPRTSNVAVWTGSRMIVWGGFQSGVYPNDGGRYDPVADSWQATSTSGAPLGRRYLSAVWTGTDMIIWGGESASSGGENTGGRYNEAGDSWLATKVDTARGQARASSVWTGVEMIEWGGNYSNEGSRYAPATDSWQPTSFSGAPVGRLDHTAIWTGGEMVVWGGSDGTTAINTGGRYSPATDSWLPTEMTNVPAARRDHTAVWTGTRMVVWGGYDGTTYLNTGGRLDPASGPWQPTSTSGAPVGREYHTAVWTGSTMIVFGGDQGSIALDSGGRYDPATDSWNAVAPSGSVRSGHVGVWTGSQMIVWGGWDGVSYLNTGGRYDPIGDTWLTTQTIGAPSGRALPVGAWTSQHMLVWGGVATGNSYLGDGGRYDPSLDAWTSMTSVGAPTGRSQHTGIWTGERLIVWGGYDPGVTNSGGLYCSCSTPETSGWNDLRATRGATTVDLAWPPGWSGVTGYNVYRDTVPSSSWGPAQRLNGTMLQTTSYQDTPPADPILFYLIKAVGSCGAESP